MYLPATYVVLLLSSLRFLHAETRLPNINYLGLGYDAFHGNPHSNDGDPGFRLAVLRIDYEEGKSDGRWFIPDGVEALQKIICGYESTSSEVSGSKSYQDTLSVEASVEGSFFVAKFSASTGFKEVKEDTSKYRRSYLSSVAKCSVYEAYVSHLAPISNAYFARKKLIRVTDRFAKAVEDLPLEGDDNKYIQFIESFGTHYVNRVTMGAKAVRLNVFDQKTWSTLKHSQFNFKLAAEASFLGASIGTSVLTDKQKKLKEKFESTRTDIKRYYVGSHPPSDGKWETWAKKTIHSPYPIKYQLYQLTHLFTSDYLPSVDPRSLLKKANRLSQAYELYCKNVSGCGAPSDDLPYVKFDLVHAVIMAEGRVKCRPGYSLLSCGIDTYETTNQVEFHRRVTPTSSNECLCYDYYNGARCFAWCTNAVKNFEIVKSGYKTGHVETFCPAKSKVIDCHIRPQGNKPELWRAHYPLRSGAGCRCYDYFGAACYASCAKNIVNYEVITQFGRKDITVTCSPNNFVLGCGMKPHGTTAGEPDRWRVVRVPDGSNNKCYCYDRRGATCYAICGQFN